jgi:hypothetical protein
MEQVVADSLLAEVPSEGFDPMVKRLVRLPIQERFLILVRFIRQRLQPTILHR